MPTKKIEFTTGPFVFDEKGVIRCLKCEDSGWIIDGTTVGGLPFRLKQAYFRDGATLSLPARWSQFGDVDTDSLSVESWKTLLFENWNHARHCETQRLGYATVYGGISVLVTAISFLASSSAVFLRPILFAALALYTILQYFVAMKSSQEFVHHIQHVSLLTAIAPDNAVFPAGMGRPMGGMLTFGKLAPKEWRRVSLASYIPMFYGLLAVAWIVLAIVSALFPGLFGRDVSMP